MDCAPPPDLVDDAGLAELVSELRDGGAESVAIGLVGGHQGAARRAVHGAAAVYSLTVAADAPLDAVAASVAAVPGRCVVVARRVPTGWELAAATSVEPEPEPEPEAEPEPAAPPLSPRVGYPLDGSAFVWSALAEAAGGGGGLVLGGSIGMARLQAGCGDASACIGPPILLGTVLGADVGAVVGAAFSRPEERPAALRGAVIGSAISLGLFAVGVATNTNDFAVALLAPPIGASLSVGTRRR